MSQESSSSEQGESNIEFVAYDNFHGLCMSLAWALFLDIALFMVRFFRYKIPFTNYQIIHGVLMTITFATSCFGIGIMIYNEGFFLFSRFSLHAIVGSFVSLFAIVSITLGVLTFKKLNSRHGGLLTIGFRNIHKIFGYVVYFLAKANLYIGGIKNRTWMIGVLSYSGVIILTWVLAKVVEVYKHKSHEVSRPALSGPMKTRYNDLLTAINKNYNYIRLREDFPFTNWVIFRNNVYDITDIPHPGGRFIFEKVKGKEISRYLYGAYSLEECDVPKYLHSGAALQLLENYYIGKVVLREDLLIPTPKEVQLQPLKKPDSSLSSSGISEKLIQYEDLQNESTLKHRWKLVRKAEITPTMTRFEFRCQDFMVKPIPNSIFSFGKYYNVRFVEDFSTVRMYSAHFAINEDVKTLRERALVYFDEMIGLGKSDISLSYLLKPKRELSLYIKKYNFLGALSKRIHECLLEMKDFVIEGPIGTGLGLPPETKGEVYIFCVGTGVFTFVDLLNFLLFKALATILKMRGFDLSKTAFATLGWDFGAYDKMKLYLIGCFKNARESYCEDIICKLAELNDNYELGLFRALTTCKMESENVKKIGGRVDFDFIKRNINPKGSWYYVCGTPEFNKDIPTMLIHSGVPREKIILC